MFGRLDEIARKFRALAGREALVRPTSMRRQRGTRGRPCRDLFDHKAPFWRSKTERKVCI